MQYKDSQDDLEKFIELKKRVYLLQCSKVKLSE